MSRPFPWRMLAAFLSLTLPIPGAQAYEAQHGALTVSYADPRDRQHLGVVFVAWDRAARDLRALGLPPPARVRLEAAGNAADFAARTGEPVNIAASTRGAVIRTQRLSALSARGLLPTTVRHEAFHTAQSARIPRWLAEGLARTFSGEGQADPRTSTGLESARANRLDAELLNRDAAQLSAAYREATVRAARLVRARGWKGALRW
ncbi:hypothetical protein GCM10010840_17180 [Deinococcus aerolatus]|uniref:DUF4157 domain-containing protein n=1 Tax=Deinococcus aerolatus TaxID=522487 RepID=A0ABQ2G871_9DEIO|nr:hypothetical protein [Deinococcus aerolatus]GGL79830.1 hypothetical protein GCM10010840_17180 [Deinococcus aerolatus]